MPEQLGKYVVLLPMPLERKTAGGIITVKDPSMRQGKVISAPEESHLRADDIVLYPHGATLVLDEKKHIGIPEEHIMLILQRPIKEALTENVES